jgi:riboflavin kinase/FMN adenylyltransferase
MELVRGLHNLRARHHGCVLTIGAFDGIHRGHQEMIRVLQARAAALQAPATLLSFEPTPREFFARGAPPGRLTRFREKYDALVRYGVERFVCARFDERMRSLSPDAFSADILRVALGARHVVVGHDFRFARNGSGSVADLRALGARDGFEVTEVPPFEIDGQRVSSSLIRAALDRGDMAQAAQLLGRPFAQCAWGCESGDAAGGERQGTAAGSAHIRLQRRAVPPLHPRRFHRAPAR